MGHIIRWTARDVKRLTEMWEAGATMAEMAAELGRTPMGIQKYAARVPNLPTRNPKARFWTIEETELLRDMWAAGRGIKVIAAKLHRNKETVYRRVRDLELPMRKVLLSPERAELLNRQKGDERYVRACLAEGGFLARAIVNGRVVELRAA